MKRLSLTLALLCSQISLNAVIILVHGTFAVEAEWCRPGGDFYKTLDLAARARRQKLIPFAWSGKLSDAGRVQGAEALAKVILSYPAGEQVTVIGHSHGGNVIALASKILSDPFARLLEGNAAVDIHTLLNEAEKLLYGVNLKQGYRSFSSERTDAIRALAQACVTMHKLKKEMLEKNPALEKENQDMEKGRRYLIDTAYFLATPVDQTSYAPNMNIIGKLFSFYSMGDSVQPVFGMYKRLYANLERVVNFRMTIENSGLFDNDPSHTEIHEPVVGKWLLAMPEELALQKFNNFGTYNPQQNGKIHFSAAGTPSFKLDRKTPAERENKENARAKANANQAAKA